MFSIKSQLKKLYLNLIFNTSNSYKKQESNNKNSIYIIGTPSHGNLGDQAIALAQHKFCEEFFSDFNVIEVQDFETYKLLKGIRSNINKDDLFFFHGGGNFGNLYSSAQENRKFVLKKIPNQRFFLFPQSIYFTKDRQGIKELKNTQNYIDKKDIVLFLREKVSFELSREFFKAPSVLTPDIVTFLEINSVEKSREGIVFLLRNDIEKNVSEDYFEKLINILRKENNIVLSDTHVGDENIIYKEKREKILIDFWNKLSSKELIITDRLHGMIFGYITKTPTIVFDNNNGKISASYNTWFTDIDYIKYVDNSISVDEIVHIIDEFKKEKFDFNRIDYDFEKMANIIRK
ncbi:polysaccharide pyruvyl transferase family protein [Vagococcus luciliae]|uniref:General stress protein 30 n=1 Tax=Vagococcus luciliae TaxID=2920380 RepID=A0ABY5P1R9_9ENTE|nr:polysaccharide pyruvyl transferase family protein [Vagococcus luciliae]UUV99895.1 General stress protein 30 [Vagococcus luciliae]